MENKNYLEDFEACYLSGCCMIIPTNFFIKVSGFDENFFLYLEDADLTRKLSSVGRCLHYSNSYINHNWGRGNYKSLKLMIVNIVSAFIIFLSGGGTVVTSSEIEVILPVYNGARFLEEQVDSIFAQTVTN